MLVYSKQRTGIPKQLFVPGGILILKHQVFYLPVFFLSQDEREARENVKREQDEAYRISLEADRAKVCIPFSLIPFLTLFREPSMPS